MLNTSVQILPRRYSYGVLSWLSLLQSRYSARLAGRGSLMTV